MGDRDIFLLLEGALQICTLLNFMVTYSMH